MPRLALPALALLALAACGYEPPPRTDRAAPAYAADLQACRDSAATGVNARNAKTGLAWFSSPVRRWGQIDDAVQGCMEGKGYGSLRWCSEAEQRDPARSGDRVVTASGLRCATPPAPGRRGRG